MTAKVAHPWWAFSQVGNRIEMHNLGTHSSERVARAACPPGAVLLTREQIRGIATGRTIVADLHGPFRLQLAFECARIVGLQEQAKRWELALAVFNGTIEDTIRADEPTHSAAEIEEAARACLKAVAPSLLQALTEEKLEAVGQKYALANGFSVSESERVGELMRIFAREGRDASILQNGSSASHHA